MHDLRREAKMNAKTVNWMFVGGFLICITMATDIARSDGKDPVALATEVRGTAETQSGESIVNAALLTEFPAGAQIDVQAGAKLVVLYLKSSDQYELAGPSSIQLGEDAPHSISGAAPLKLRSMIGKD